MIASRRSLWLGLFVSLVAAPLLAQEGETNTTPAGVVQDVQKNIDAITEEVNSNDRAREASAGILRPIYDLAERCSFPTFHWIAFTCMVAGVVSFSLQVVIGKLVVLSRLGFSLTELLSDVLGLVVSLIGLVLTTQAATENSNFTSSPLAVLSAVAVGLIAGLIFFFWGQRLELEAVKGRQAPTATN